jgi:hypothetical protein
MAVTDFLYNISVHLTKDELQQRLIILEIVKPLVIDMAKNMFDEKGTIH